MALLLAALVAGSTTLPVTAATGRASRGAIDVLVIAGQSNALGYSSYVIDPKTHEDVFTDASRSPADRTALLTWDESGVESSGTAPVALDTPQRLNGASSPIFGPEVGLARALYARGDRHVLIVKVAIDGSSLAEDWLPGQADYKALLAQVRAAESWARKDGWVPSVKALYWFQGETDATNSTWAAAYGSNLSAFLKGIRKSLALGPSGPVVVTQTDLSDYIRFEQAHRLCTSPSCSAEWTWNTEVMRAQAAAAGRSTFVATTSALPRFDNFIHLTDAAELTLGETYANLTDHFLRGPR